MKINVLPEQRTTAPIMSVETEHSLAVAWREHSDTSARAQLIEAHVRLVRSIAHSLSNRGISADDLVSEGNVGLIRAVDRFDPSAGTRLSTFAFTHIRSAMLGLFREASVRGRLSYKARRDVASLDAASATLSVRMGRDADLDELASELGWTASETSRVIRTREQVVTWREVLARERHALSATNTDTMVRYEERMLASKKLEGVLSVLNPLERTVIELSFGVGAQGRMDSHEVAAITKLSPREVNRVKSFAHAKLVRHASRARD